jgi:hypothetical protein
VLFEEQARGKIGRAAKGADADSLADEIRDAA